jgi:hypothetical protein
MEDLRHDSGKRMPRLHVNYPDIALTDYCGLLVLPLRHVISPSK